MPSKIFMKLSTQLELLKRPASSQFNQRFTSAVNLPVMFFPIASWSLLAAHLDSAHTRMNQKGYVVFEQSCFMLIAMGMGDCTK